jgi:hypothetical protein
MIIKVCYCISPLYGWHSCNVCVSSWFKFWIRREAILTELFTSARPRMCQSSLYRPCHSCWRLHYISHVYKCSDVIRLLLSVRRSSSLVTTEISAGTGDYRFCGRTVIWLITESWGIKYCHEPHGTRNQEWLLRDPATIPLTDKLRLPEPAGFPVV